jgi:transposase
MHPSIPSPSYFVGIDVSKNTLDFARFTPGAPSLPLHSVVNTPEGHHALIEALRPHAVERVALEATGGYERGVTAALQHAGFSVAVVNPKAVRRFAGALGITAKTDRLDAQVIARFAACVQPPPAPVKTASQQHRADLVTRHRQLTRMRAAELARRHHAQPGSIRQCHDDTIAFLTAQIDRAADELDQLIQQDPHTKPIARLLRTVEGVGPGTTRTLIAYLPELGRVSRQRIAALVGVAPYHDDSGSHQGKRRIQGGRTNVRCILYMATLTATRAKGVIAQHYQHLTNRGKPKKSALTACMRKLLIHLNSLLAKHFQNSTVIT